MKIHFTAFNGGQEHFVFDTENLEKGEKLLKFLINKDDNGMIYIVPMVVKDEYTLYAKDVLQKL